MVFLPADPSRSGKFITRDYEIYRTRLHLADWLPVRHFHANFLC